MVLWLAAGCLAWDYTKSFLRQDCISVFQTPLAVVIKHYWDSTNLKDHLSLIFSTQNAVNNDKHYLHVS